MEFDHTHLACKFIDRVRRRTGPGDPSSVVGAQLVDISRPPIPAGLQLRLPLSISRNKNKLMLLATTTNNLSETLEWSGRAVILSGFPTKLSILHILEWARTDSFELMRAPSTIQNLGRLEDIVHISPLSMSSGLNSEGTANDLRTGSSSWTSYLLRLPSTSEAHRMVRQWNATRPQWGSMQGDWEIRASIVW